MKKKVRGTCMCFPLSSRVDKNFFLSFKSRLGPLLRDILFFISLYPVLPPCNVSLVLSLNPLWLSDRLGFFNGFASCRFQFKTFFTIALDLRRPSNLHLLARISPVLFGSSKALNISSFDLISYLWVTLLIFGLHILYRKNFFLVLLIKIIKERN